MDRNLTMGIIASLLLHGVLAIWVVDLDPRLRPLLPEPDKRVVRAVREQVELPKPKPPEPKPPEPKPEPKPVEKTEQAQPTEAPKPTAAPKRTPQPKADQPKAETPPPPTNEPPPLVLSKTYGAGGDDGVAVQTGKDDVLGDPGVQATEENTRRRAVVPTTSDTGGTGQDEAGEAVVPGRKVEVVLAKPKVANCTGFVDWPEGAPASGRVVTVQVLLDIGPDGKVRKVKILRGAGEPFDSQAIKDMQRCPFEPGTRDGKPVSTKVGFAVDFKPQS